MAAPPASRLAAYRGIGFYIMDEGTACCCGLGAKSLTEP